MTEELEKGTLGEDILLEVKELNVYYGLIRAIKDVSFKVRKGEIVTLIGANGAGKTTTMQSITGLLHPKSGHIFYKGKELVGMPTHKIVKMGLTLVPEGRRVFAELTVYENLQMGGFTEKDRNKLKENWFMNCSPGWVSAGNSWQAPFRAGNSRCLPSAER